MATRNDWPAAYSRGTLHFGNRVSDFIRISGFGFRILVLGLIISAATARAQTRPYIGYVYPAGGQTGTTFQVKLGGQGLDDINASFVTGTGVTVRIRDYQRPLNPQEIQLLNEQRAQLKRNSASAGSAMAMSDSAMAPMMDSAVRTIDDKAGDVAQKEDPGALVQRIEKRIADYVNRPASAALASIVYMEVTVAPDAEPGQRELRVTTARGVSNPMPFHVGQHPERTRKPMLTASFQVLGKEELALRKRPTNEVEVQIVPPCTLNGQIASGEQNRYRFTARKGERLVITTQARQLIPFIADAVPGWFQPVIVLYDAKGREVAFADDYRFKPDPSLLYEVPEEGEYILAIHDAIYRGREDFVYRITIGQLPFVTSLFPLGARAGQGAKISAKGWNLSSTELVSPADFQPGRRLLTINKGGMISNPLPFALDTLPEKVEREKNDTIRDAQTIELPVIVNGRIGHANDWDVFKFRGRAGSSVVCEAYARALESPLDAVLKLTDESGNLIVFNDDQEDITAGANTHHADSYLTATLPADGVYNVHIGDTTRSGGDEYAYRLRISEPMPSFALRVVPSSVSLRSFNNASVTVYVVRKDGFTNTIRICLDDSVAGFLASPVTVSGTQTMARLNIKTRLAATPEPVNLQVIGWASIGGRSVTNIAVPAEDRMQAFLWRHLVPASEFKALVYDSSVAAPSRRKARPRPITTAATPTNTVASAATTNAPAKPKFSKQQVAGRLRQLKLLFEEGLLTDDFYEEKVAECEAAQAL